MNLSPFCTLNANSMLPKWQSAVNETYGVSGNGLEYISGLPSQIRREYKKPIMQEREIISSLSEVNLDLFFAINVPYLMQLLGQSCLQCLQKGYSCGEHLFWPVHGIR